MSVPNSVIEAAKTALRGDADDAVGASLQMLATFGLEEARAILIVATLSKGPSAAREVRDALKARAKSGDKRVVEIGRSLRDRGSAATATEAGALLNEAEDLVLATRIAEAADYSAEVLKSRCEEIKRRLGRLVPSPRERRMAVSYVAVSKVAHERRFGPFDSEEDAEAWAKANLPDREVTIEAIFNPNVQVELPVEPTAGSEEETPHSCNHHPASDS